MMADVTLCRNADCPRRRTCARWMLAPDGERWQSYARWEPLPDGGCDGYAMLRPGDRLRKDGA